MHTLPQRQVHLDFHTSEHVPGIGSKFDKKQFQECLQRGHVNSITVFAKCHHGWAYFPSEANKIHPQLNFDLLGQMLEACAEIGVQAPIYKMANMMHIPVLGFVENYAYLECPDCGKKIEVFGKSHLDQVAAEFDLPILARLPIDPSVAAAYDNGLMETVYTDALADAVEAVKKA